MKFINGGGEAIWSKYGTMKNGSENTISSFKEWDTLIFS